LPGADTRAISAFALFTAVQAADAGLTAMGVSRFGVVIEANPLVASCIHAYGVLCGLLLAKSLAIFLGAILHVTSQTLVLVGLTVFCVFAALVPWSVALASL
jgi:hypothetical protein